MLHTSPVSRQSQEDRRREKTYVAGAAGAAPEGATTPGSDPTEWEGHKDRIKKELLQPDSQSASQPLQRKHTLGTAAGDLVYAFYVHDVVLPTQAP
ncbi:unnamed protein product [Schistocephalus solidus]|uniref:Uncharacterized protein n=1 Tax=Schistocephalus solidus TaxID=70667 RepID=A0A183SQG4_SCHSO|nr:unnamed protein product [Schistocephalus solidus]